jgi:hypothetical protein
MNIWKSEKGGIYIVMQIYRAAGKDPSSGRVMYEQRMPNDIPSLYFNTENATAFHNLIRNQKCDADFTLNFMMQLNKNSKITVAPDNGNVKITIETDKGAHSITFNTMTIGTQKVNPNWDVFQKMFAVGVNKLLYGKLDPDEFNVGNVDDEVEEG